MKIICISLVLLRFINRRCIFTKVNLFAQIYCNKNLGSARTKQEIWRYLLERGTLKAVIRRFFFNQPICAANHGKCN